MTRRNPSRKFQPWLDGLESRLVLSTVVDSPAVHARVVTAKTDLNSKVLKFAQSKVGLKVGDGECSTLADEAVKSAGGRRFYDLGPTGKDADYVWGRKIGTLTPSSGSISSIKAGDIIQFRDVKFSQQTKVTKSNGSWTSSTKTYSYGHHTAVVESVSGNFVNLLQQNVGSAGKSADAKRIVQRGTIWATGFSTTGTAKDGTKTVVTYKFTGGTMWVYRPYS